MKDYSSVFDFVPPSQFETKPKKEVSETHPIRLREVDQLGKTTFEFGKELLVPSFKSTEHRNLQDALTLEEIVDRSVLSIKIDSQFSREQVELSWTPLEFNSKTLVV